MKILFVLLLLFSTPLTFAEIPELSNITLQGDDIEIVFGELNFMENRNQYDVKNTIEHIQIGDFIFNNVYVKSYNTGFTVKDLDAGLAIYAIGSSNTGNPYDYTAHVYYQGEKFKALLDLKTESTSKDDVSDKSIEQKYQPNLETILSFDLRTYWKQDFNLEIIVFDSNKSPTTLNKDVFDGRLDGASITTTILFENNVVKTYEGITENGVFEIAHYFDENISNPGEYTIDVVVVFDGQTISESDSFFLIGATPEGGDCVGSCP